jgi:xanthosine utilization system XapX-like protein
MSEFNWASFLLSQIWNVPFLIVYCVGIVFALLFWNRHPAVSILSIVAFLILIGSQVLGIGTQFWMTGASTRGMSSQEIGQFLSIIGIVRAVLGTVAWILLITALFGWRSPAAPRSSV